MNNSEIPYFPRASYAENAIPNVNLNDFSHISSLKEQNLSYNSKGFSGAPQAVKKLLRSSYFFLTSEYFIVRTVHVPHLNYLPKHGVNKN
ncbi:unnamed protein product [Schistosoma turkestanicum]|nr:unnamed protein product [Schistosoma turkestanicum]